MKDTTASMLFGMVMGALAMVAVLACFMDVISRNTDKVCNAYDTELQRLGYQIMPEMQPYRDAEKRLQDLIYRIYGVENVPDDVVKWADTVALGIEAQATMAPLTEPQEWIWCCMQAQGFIAMRWKLAEMDCFMAEAAFSKALLRAIAGQYIPEGYFKWPV